MVAVAVNDYKMFRVTSRKHLFHIDNIYQSGITNEKILQSMEEKKKAQTTPYYILMLDVISHHSRKTSATIC